MSNTVKEIRLKLGITQDEMATRLGCSKMTERRCEYEGRLPRTVAVLNNLRKLAKQANVSILEEAAQKDGAK